MNKTIYKIAHFNNELTLLEADKKDKIYSSFWFMEFGKTCSEIKDSDGNRMYYVTKKFQFWKWRMVYLIEDNQEKKSILISLNTKNTVFKIEIENAIYEIKMHYKKRKSIYKNDKKIAEIDASFSDESYTELIKIIHLENEDIKISFLLISCLLIGETELHNKKVVMKSQKELEKNDEPWS
jgi:hypothetical protein